MPSWSICAWSRPATSATRRRMSESFTVMLKVASGSRLAVRSAPTLPRRHGGQRTLFRSDRSSPTMSAGSGVLSRLDGMHRQSKGGRSLPSGVGHTPSSCGPTRNSTTPLRWTSTRRAHPRGLLRTLPCDRKSSAIGSGVTPTPSATTPKNAAQCVVRLSSSRSAVVRSMSGTTASAASAESRSRIVAFTSTTSFRSHSAGLTSLQTFRSPTVFATCEKAPAFKRLRSE